jgi:putative membrane protein
MTDGSAPGKPAASAPHQATGSAPQQPPDIQRPDEQRPDEQPSDGRPPAEQSPDEDPPEARPLGEEPSDEPPSDGNPPDEEPWRRLNPRMLLVHPLRELIRYLPLLLVAIIAGSVSGEPWWTYALSGLGLVIGLLRWFTTSYRITPTHVEVRRGLLNRTRLSVPRQRIRSVDVDATLLHRLVGLVVVHVGTGAAHGQGGLDFDGVEAKDVPGLRAELLRGVAAAAAADAGDGDADAAPASDAPSRNLSGWRPSWARYAPFTMTGVASLFVAAFFVLQIQFFDGGVLTRLPIVQALIASIGHLPVVQLVVGAALVLVIAASVIALVRYVLAYSGFSVHRTDEGTLHVSHGLLRTRQVTLDESRLRGVQVNEPLSLRIVGAASAHAIMTGLGRERGGLAIIDPPGPRTDVERVAESVLGRRDALECALRTHGARAVRRRYTRAAEGVAVLAAIALVAQLLGYVNGFIWILFAVIVPAGVVIAADRSRSLGHALLPGVLVARSGSLLRRRVALETDGIIGWTVRRTLFQRRAGLATLVATTAAGRHRYEVLDVPIDEAWRLAEAVSVSRTADRVEP